MFSKENMLALVKELVWIAITLLIAAAVLYPIYTRIQYNFYLSNIAFIFLSITYFRWTLTLRSLPFLRPAWARFIVFAINVNLFIVLMQQEQSMLMFIDDYDIKAFGWPKVIMYDEVIQYLFRYIYRLVTLFGTASLILLVVFNLRLIVSWWQFYKYKANTLLED